MDEIIPEKTVIIKPKHIIKQPWMSPTLLKSSNKANKLYRESIGWVLKNKPEIY